jgi:hypothetical protein
MKRWKTTLVVVLVFAAILAYVLLVERNRAPPPRPGVTPSPTPVLLLDIALDNLRAVHVTDGTHVLRLAREGGDWQIVEGQGGGPNAPADATALSLPLEDLAHLDARIVVADAVTDPATYGLAPPGLVLTLQAGDGGAVRLVAGRETPDGTAFYVQLDGDPRLYLVDHYRIEPFARWLLSPPYADAPAGE